MINEKFDIFVYKYLEEFKFSSDARHSANVIDQRGQGDPRHRDMPRADWEEQNNQWNTHVDKLRSHNVARDASPAPKTVQQHVDDIGKEWEQQTEPINHFH